MAENGCPQEATMYSGGCMNQYCSTQLSCYTICQVETVGIDTTSLICFGKDNQALCPNPHPTTGTTGFATSTTGQVTTGKATTGDGASTNSNQVSTTGLSGASSLSLFWALFFFVIVLLI